MLRALLCHLSLWDPSSHGLLALKHVLMAFRMQPPPLSLYPMPQGGGAATAGDGDGGSDLALSDSHGGEAADLKRCLCIGGDVFSLPHCTHKSRSSIRASQMWLDPGIDSFTPSLLHQVAQWWAVASCCPPSAQRLSAWVAAWPRLYQGAACCPLLSSGRHGMAMSSRPSASQVRHGRAFWTSVCLCSGPYGTFLGRDGTAQTTSSPIPTCRECAPRHRLEAGAAARLPCLQLASHPGLARADCQGKDRFEESSRSDGGGTSRSGWRHAGVEDDPQSFL